MKTIALHAAKNSHPTTNKYESVIRMNLGLRREASCSRLRALDDQTLFGRGHHQRAAAETYSSEGAGGAWCMCFAMRASWLAAISFILACWSGVSN